MAPRRAAAVAAVGAEQPRFFRKRKHHRLHVKQLLRLPALVVLQGVLLAQALRLRLQNKADGLARFPVVDGKRLLSPHMKQQIALADTAPQHDLNGIHTAGVVFRDADHFLVVREGQIQQADGILRGLIADRQTAADMAVERSAFFKICHSSSSPFGFSFT